jgi:hypothetical protein
LVESVGMEVYSVSIGLRGVFCFFRSSRAYLSYARNDHVADAVLSLVPHYASVVRLARLVRALARLEEPATIGPAVRRPIGKVTGPFCLRPSGCFSLAITEAVGTPGWCRYLGMLGKGCVTDDRPMPRNGVFLVC